MSILFYQGAGVETYWHRNNARLSGFTPQSPGMDSTPTRLMHHIARGTTTTPYVSLTVSYPVAKNYAIFCGRAIATPTNPGVVYELETNDSLPAGLQIIDLVKAIANSLPAPLSSMPYQLERL